MPELTPEQIAQGIFLDANGVPTNPDGTPLPGWSGGAPIAEPPVSDGGAGILAQIAATQGRVAGEAPGGGPTSPDTAGYGFGPYYSASPQDYPDNRTPLAPPQWTSGMEGTPPPGALISDGGGIPIGWEQYKSSDRSTGGGFFTAEDLFGEVPYAFQEGASLPSTNNWRLLPGQYRSPQFIMRNGRIINLKATDMRGPPIPDIGFGNNYGGPLWNLGVGAAFGVPAGRSAGYTQSFGWPGNDQWLSATYWNG